MRNKTDIDGSKIKRAILASGFTKEMVVASVQTSGLRFSLAGLDKMLANKFPKKDLDMILEEIAQKCRCLVSDFEELEAKQEDKESA